MSFRWPILLLAAVLLLPPLPWSAALRRYVLSPRRNASAKIQFMAKCWQNWVDLLRAGLGAFLLVNMAILPGAQIQGAGIRSLLVEATVLIPAVMIQMVRIGREIQLVAPVFYLCGIALVLPGYAHGGFAVFVGWLFAIGGRRPAYQLPIMAAALAAAGPLLDSTITLPLALACGLIFLPVLVAFMFQRPLAFVAREGAPAVTERDSSEDSAAPNRKAP